MRIVIPVASCIVDERTRSAFSEACLDEIAERLDREEIPLTFKFKTGTIGRTVPGTQKIENRVLEVQAEATPAFLSQQDLETMLPALGAGCAGRIRRRSNVGEIELIESIHLSEVSLVALRDSCDPRRPCRKV